MRKAAQTAVLASLILALISIPIVEVAVGDPVPAPNLPAMPDMDQPSITINQPVDKVYNESSFLYLLTVQKPQSWFDGQGAGQTATIWYILDGN